MVDLGGGPIANVEKKAEIPKVKFGKGGTEHSCSRRFLFKLDRYRLDTKSILDL